MIDNQVLEKLNSGYEAGSKALSEFLSRRGKLEESELLEILKLDEKLLISEFLDNYEYFSDADLKLVEQYINENLDSIDRLFVSDLIEFASLYELIIPYSKCIDFLDKHEGDNTYVQLATLIYIRENLKSKYVPLFYDKLVDILNNSNCNQRVQLNAAFILFRITGESKYLGDIIDLVVNGEGNDEMMKNILELAYNDEKYFPASMVLKPLVISSVS